MTNYDGGLAAMVDRDRGEFPTDEEMTAACDLWASLDLRVVLVEPRVPFAHLCRDGRRREIRRVDAEWYGALMDECDRHYQAWQAGRLDNLGWQEVRARRAALKLWWATRTAREIVG